LVIRISSFAAALVAFLITMTPSAAAEDLRVVTSRHYRIHTDLDRDLIQDLSRRMDAMYDEYARRLADFPLPVDSDLFEAYLVHTEHKYLDIAGIGAKGTAGIFVPGRHLLAAFLDRQGRDTLRRTLQHEAFHQFAESAVGPDLPVWLNEGLAQVFEEGIWTGDGFDLGQVPPRRLRQLSDDVTNRRLIRFRTLLSMSHEQWNNNWADETASVTEYNQSWAMTHFLVYDTDGNGTPRYRGRLIQMLRLIRDHEDGESAFRSAFSDNIEGFQGRFLEWVSRVQPTNESLLIENQQVLGDLFREIYAKGKSFDTLPAFRSYVIRGQWRMTYQRGHTTWTSAADPSIYFRRPDGQPFGNDELYFETSNDRALPDIVCRYGHLQLRTRFSAGDTKLEHETLIEAVR
jgi:hypothetical protein